MIRAPEQYQVTFVPGATPPQDDQVHILIYSGVAPLDPDDDNVDVEVILPDGTRYVATFFTIQNIVRLMDKDAVTGACAQGTYFWAADLLIVRRLTVAVILATVADLIAQQELATVFCLVDAADETTGST